MANDEPVEGRKPATPYLKAAEDGRLYLQGGCCKACGQTYLGTRLDCAHCFARDSVEPIELGLRGRLYNYTIVHRSYPGIKVPFISAIVDLDGGGSLKGNLIDIDPESAALAFDIPVDVVFRGAEIANPAATGFVSHFFTPGKDLQAA